MNLPAALLESPQNEPTLHADYVIDLAKKLADGKRPGVFATVDEHGAPHLRWMATVSLHDWPLLFTIASPESRKIQHIGKQPCVSWMFSNEEMNVIINIRGRARILTDGREMQRVWELLEDTSKAYFLNSATTEPGFAVIETEIESIDATMPKYDIRFHAHSADLEYVSREVGE